MSLGILSATPDDGHPAAADGGGGAAPTPPPPTLGGTLAGLPPRLASIPQCTVLLPGPGDDAGGGSGVLEKFTVRATQVSSYRLSLLRRATRALALSDVTKLRTNHDGMLSLAIQLRVGGRR